LRPARWNRLVLESDTVRTIARRHWLRARLRPSRPALVFFVVCMTISFAPTRIILASMPRVLRSPSRLLKRVAQEYEIISLQI
jgi:hypothetical protein